MKNMDFFIFDVLIPIFWVVTHILSLIIMTLKYGKHGLVIAGGWWMTFIGLFMVIYGAWPFVYILILGIGMFYIAIRELLLLKKQDPSQVTDSKE
jgi:hypothetical protein